MITAEKILLFNVMPGMKRVKIITSNSQLKNVASPYKSQDSLDQCQSMLINEDQYH